MITKLLLWALVLIIAYFMTLVIKIAKKIIEDPDSMRELQNIAEKAIDEESEENNSNYSK